MYAITEIMTISETLCKICVELTFEIFQAHELVAGRRRINILNDDIKSLKDYD